ncbi:hypothetical protein ACOI4D_14975 [Escherichia coli]
MQFRPLSTGCCRVSSNPMAMLRIQPVAVAGAGGEQRQIFAVHPAGIGMSQWRIMQGVEVAR